MHEIHPHPLARAAIMVATAGRHSLLLLGSPGVGATIMMRRAGAILPPLTAPEAHDVLMLSCLSGRRVVGVPIDEPMRPPVRMPHHTVSRTGLIGGGAPVRPGEVSLAHHGILALIDLPEFAGECLRELRYTAKDRQATIVTARGVTRIPASFTLIASTHPCPCGYLGHPDRACMCGASARARHHARVFQGPAFDAAIHLGQLDHDPVPGLADVVPPDAVPACAAMVASVRARLPEAPSIEDTCDAFGFPIGTAARIRGAATLRAWADTCVATGAA